MFRKFTNLCIALVNKYLPDAFLFAVILTFIVFLGGIAMTDQTPIAMVAHWYHGFWNLLGFSMQMALVIVTGNAMAQAPVIKRLLRSIALSAKTPASAIAITTLISLAAYLLNWGFGLVVGVLIAREMAKVVKNCDYRLLIASAYSAITVWHGGLSASIPLVIASGGAAVTKATGGVIVDPIPITQTIFSTLNLSIIAGIVIALPLAMVAMRPKDEDVVIVDPMLLVDIEIPETEAKVPADKIERSKILWALLLAFGFTAVILYFVNRGFNPDLNFVNFLFMFLGIALHGTLRKYIDAISIAASCAAGVLLQFPFYAGIMGMMTGLSTDGVSVAILLSNMFINISTPVTFPLFTFLSAGLVNFFVPSGGGQWAVQAPVMMPAGHMLSVDPAVTALAISWGDAWTNTIQPFWALPALAIARLSARDIMGYCVISLLVTGTITSSCFLIYGFLQ